jgi:hypothetical protein
VADVRFPAPTTSVECASTSFTPALSTV